MTKYSDVFKLQVVEQYLEGKGGLRSLAQRHDLSHSMIKRWVGWYSAHGIEGLKKKFTHYSGQFKLSVLTYIWDNAVSYNQAAAHFNIRNPVILSQWERRYRDGGLDALQARPKGRPKAMSTPPPEPVVTQEDAQLSHAALLKELNYLRMENAYLKKLQALVQAKQQRAQATKRK